MPRSLPLGTKPTHTNQPHTVPALRLWVPDADGRYDYDTRHTGPEVKADEDPSTLTGQAVGSLITDSTDGVLYVANSGGTPAAVAMQADLDALEASVSAESVMLTRETAGAGGKLELLEATANGTSKVTLQAPAALGANRTITVPDADVDLADAAQGVADAAAAQADATQALADAAAAQATADAALPTASDLLVQATITVGNATGGSTNAAVAVQVSQLGGGPLTSAREVLIVGSAGADLYRPYNGSPDINSVSFSAATVGTIVATGPGWCLARTDATGAFACTCANTDDETLNFVVKTAEGISSLTYKCLVTGCVPDAATWSP